MQSRLPQHRVLSRLPEFLKLALTCNELRLQRMGLLVGSIDQLSAVKRAALVAEAYAWKGGSTAARVAKAAKEHPDLQRQLLDQTFGKNVVRVVMRVHQARNHELPACVYRSLIG